MELPSEMESDTIILAVQCHRFWCYLGAFSELGLHIVNSLTSSLNYGSAFLNQNYQGIHWIDLVVSFKWGYTNGNVVFVGHQSVAISRRSFSVALVVMKKILGIFHDCFIEIV